jgi:peptide/nickel transport system substrate-binding protein
MRLIRAGVGLGVGVVVLAGCGGGGSSGSGGSGSGGVVDGGTFTMATSADPGNLDPQASAASGLFQQSHLAYDSLVYTDDKGKVVSGMAEKWQVDGSTVTLTLKDGITCSDGSTFTAKDAADNVNYIADPAHQSPFLGVFLPAGVKATSDDASRTVTLTLAGPAPFVMEGLAGVPIVCAKGLTDRTMLSSKTDGTGPYQLTEVVPSDHYTYTKRTGYSWGPGGAGTATKGLPDQIVVKVISNETTAANLLLSGDLNEANILGPDADRLDKQKLFSDKLTAVLGEMFYNHKAGRPGADPAVRKALTQALDLGQLAKVVSSNRGGPGTSFAASGAAACPGDSISAALPEHDVAAAGKLLDDAGWKAGANGTRSKDGTPLAVTFTYDTALGTPGSAAAELVNAAWKKLGVAVTTKPQDETALVNTVFSTGDWDVAWVPINVSSPDQLVPFLSGPATPEGNNFASIDNADYTSGVADAMKQNGTAGCSTWLKAESALVRDADVIPFANQNTSFFGSHATFAVVDVVQPTSIRMRAR